VLLVFEKHISKIKKTDIKYTHMYIHSKCTVEILEKNVYFELQDIPKVRLKANKRPHTPTEDSSDFDNELRKGNMLGLPPTEPSVFHQLPVIVVAWTHSTAAPTSQQHIEAPRNSSDTSESD
jgi:hypothetical protein